jgi:hypothetical protein
VTLTVPLNKTNSAEHIVIHYDSIEKPSPKLPNQHRSGAFMGLIRADGHFFYALIPETAWSN